MKFLALTIALLTTSTVWARQYIQCSILADSTDVAVVNLTTNKTGTLFLSSGMQNPEDERILFNIEYSEKKNGVDIFKIVDGNVNGSVAVPSQVIGKAADSFDIHLVFGSVEFDYGCFSRIYND
jgi:hypothetical protein